MPYHANRHVSYVYIVVNRDAAWTDFQHLDGFGIGGSKANRYEQPLHTSTHLSYKHTHITYIYMHFHYAITSLLWAASRPPAPPGSDITVHAPDYSGSILQTCAGNSACDAIGMTGKCCPSDNPAGVFLGCCPQLLPQPNN